MVAVSFWDPKYRGNSIGELSPRAMHGQDFIVDAPRVRHYVYSGYPFDLWPVLLVFTFNKEPARLSLRDLIGNAQNPIFVRLGRHVVPPVFLFLQVVAMKERREC